MEKRDDSGPKWHIKAALPLGWRAEIRSGAMKQGLDLKEWIVSAIREKAERDGIQLPAEDENTGEAEPDAA